MSGYILIKITKINLRHVRLKEFQQKYRFLTPDMTMEITVINLYLINNNITIVDLNKFTIIK